MRIGWIVVLAVLGTLGPVAAQDVKSHLDQGAQMVREQKLDEALSHYKKALEVDPKSATALYQLGWIYNEQHKYGTAVVTLKQASELAPGDVAVWNELGFAYAKLKNGAAGRASFNKAVELKKDNVTGWLGIADIYFEQDKNYKQAAEFYTKAIEAGASDAAVYYRTGWCYCDAGNYQLAVPALRKATELAPDLAATWLELGFALLGQKQHKEAEVALLKALQLDPKVHLAHLYLGRAYLRMGDTAKARKQAELLKPHNAAEARQLLDELPQKTAKPAS